ncbi:MAG: RNA polymerase factor sigma-32, partial [Deltaproteobacteria bacterium]|nr:RNA polymerase factor sigma-32 [Deltaproteobacteria bacterium]
MKPPLHLSHAGSDSSTVAMYYRDVSRVPLLSATEELDLATRYVQSGNRRYADRLVQANLRFVIKVAMDYRNYGFPLMDLVQEGNLGLLKAVQRFDPDRGYRLISYGVWWIRAHIQEYILRNWSLVKIGTTQLQRRLFNNLQSSQKRLERLLASSSEEERLQMLAREVGGTVEDVLEMQQRLAGRDASLDAPSGNGDGDGTSLLDRLPLDRERTDVEAAVAEEELRQRMGSLLAGAVKSLGERERTIVRLRHLEDEPSTLKDLGERFGVSKERI